MYLVKVNGNYNIVISDINVTIDAHQREKLVEKELFDSSSIAKNLVAANFITFEEYNPSKEEVEPEIVTVDDTKGDVFVAHESEETVNEGVFIKQPITEAEPAVEEQQIEEIEKTEEVKDEPVIEVESEVKEVSPKKVEKKVEAKIEVKAEEEKPETKKVTRRRNEKK